MPHRPTLLNSTAISLINIKKGPGLSIYVTLASIETDKQKLCIVVIHKYTRDC